MYLLQPLNVAGGGVIKLRPGEPFGRKRLAEFGLARIETGQRQKSYGYRLVDFLAFPQLPHAIDQWIPLAGVLMACCSVGVPKDTNPPFACLAKGMMEAEEVEPDTPLLKYAVDLSKLKCPKDCPAAILGACNLPSAGSKNPQPLFVTVPFTA